MSFYPYRKRSFFQRFRDNFVYGLFVLVVAVAIAGVAGSPFIFGIGGAGPTRIVTDATVTNLHIDVSGSDGNTESHYMVYTDKGVFEVDNGILLGMWNADEVYAKIVKDKTYNITTKGNKVVGFFFQEYPYIVSVQPVTK